MGLLFLSDAGAKLADIKVNIPTKSLLLIFLDCRAADALIVLSGCSRLNTRPSATPFNGPLVSSERAENSFSPLSLLRIAQRLLVGVELSTRQ
jgi:hypothetical protein